MDTITDKRVINILANAEFIDYILEPNSSLNEKWENYFQNNPDQIPIANQARIILLKALEEQHLTDKEIKEMEISILEKCGLMNHN